MVGNGPEGGRGSSRGTRDTSYCKNAGKRQQWLRPEWQRRYRGLYLSLEEGERAKKRKNCHGKLPKEMMPGQSGESGIGVGCEDRENTGKWVSDVQAGSCQSHFSLMKLWGPMGE